MKTQITIAIFVLPSLAFAQKPDCETIRKFVESNREAAIKKLEAEIEPLEKLKNDIRRGKGKLEGKDGMKPAREQLKIVIERIETIEAKIEDAKKSTPFPSFQFRELKVGDSGYFGNGSSDFLINEILDDQTFTAFHRYVVSVPNVGGITAYRPELRTSEILYFIKGIKTKGMVDGKTANWKGYLYCSGTKKLQLKSGNETVFVLEPFDVDSCFSDRGNP